jgi:hypothetical protein
MAGNAPTGNIFQTAATQAKEPYGQFAKANQAEQNLLRQVGLEAETLDIGSEQKTAAAAAKDASSMARLEKQIQADKDLYALEKGENLTALIEARAQESIAENKFNNYTAATNEATWVYKGSKEYKDRTIGGVLSEKQSNDAKAQAKFAKNQGKKNGVGKIYYDPYKDQVLEVAIVDSEYTLRPVGGETEVVDEAQTIDEAEGQQIEGIATSLGIDYEIIPPRDEKFTGKDWNSYYKRTVNPKAVTLGELKRLISKEKLRLLVERKQKQN